VKPTHTARAHANRTGVQLHPDSLDDMLSGTVEFGPTSSGTAEAIAAVRIAYARDAEPAGTMPASEDLAPELEGFLDRLGARHAFERVGTRLYEVLISKLDAYGTFAGGPSRDDLRAIRDEEHRHMVLLQDTILQLGGDPTAMTPSANLQLLASRGIGDVLRDPRTTLIDGLEIMLIAELTDQESWSTLGGIARDMGQKDLAAKIDLAERTEQTHLTTVRAWINAARAAWTRQR
jgi:hypothetical protein